MSDIVILDDRTINECGEVHFTAKFYVDRLSLGETDFSSFTGSAECDEILLYNNRCNDLGLDDWCIPIYEPLCLTSDELHEFDHILQTDWLIPGEYLTLDVREHIMTQHALSENEIARVDEELELYGTLGLYGVLRAMVYIVDTCRTNNVVWGVGRGSSVSSYVLYLIGVHRINPMTYGLPISDFLKSQ